MKKTIHDQIIETGPQASNEGPFLKDLFESFEVNKVEYCVLRNYDSLPHSLLGSDLDMLISPNAVKNARTLFESLAEKHGGFVAWWKRSDSLYKVLCLGFLNGEAWGVPIDLHIAMRWSGLDYYCNQQVLSRSIVKDGIRVAAVYDAMLMGFLKEILMDGCSGKDYLPGAASGLKQSPEIVRKELSALFGKEAELILKTLRTQDYQMAKGLTGALRKCLLRRQALGYPLSLLRNEVIRFLAYCHRPWNKLGISVAVLGPDGVGKSTLIGAVSPEIERLIHAKTKHQYARPGLLPWLGKFIGRDVEKVDPTSDPHARPPSGMLLSVLRLSYYTMDYLLGYLLLTYPLLLRHGTVFFFDRYFYDYFFDPARWRINTPGWVISAFSLFIPKPDLIVMLTGDPEILNKRKPELPAEEIRFQCKRIFLLRKKFKDAVYIDTSGESEISCQELLRAIIDTFRHKPSSK